MMKKLYLIGSLRNPRVPDLAIRLRKEHPEFEVFDDWYSAGPEADDYWKTYEQERGRVYTDALSGHAARHVFEFDKHHLDTSSHALLVLPAGKSGHMEIMYSAYGVGSKTAILLDPEDVRWDVMYQFVPTILKNDDEIGDWVNVETDEITVGGLVPCDEYGIPLDGKEGRRGQAKDGASTDLTAFGNFPRFNFWSEEVRQP